MMANQTTASALSSSKTPILFDGLAYSLVLTVFIALAGYVFLVLTSGMVVRYSFTHAGVDLDSGNDDSTEKEDTGRAIGKLENVLLLSLMLLEAYTALGVIFAAKSIVRRADMDTGDTSYYLTGTVANFTYSVTFGLAIHVLLWSLVKFDVVGWVRTMVC